MNSLSKKTTLQLTETIWRATQPAWRIKCQDLELVVTKHGLNIASVTNINDPLQINPLWTPKWPWISPLECPHLHIPPEYESVQC